MIGFRIQEGTKPHKPANKDIVQDKLGEKYDQHEE